MVDRHVDALRTGSPDQAQHPILQEHVVIWREDVNTVWLDGYAVADLQHWHQRHFREQVCQRASRIRPQMLNDDKRQAGIGPKILQ